MSFNSSSFNSSSFNSSSFNSATSSPLTFDSVVSENILETVRGIWNMVSGQTDLSPRNAVINRGLSRLVAEVMNEKPVRKSTTGCCLEVLKGEGVCEKIRDFCQNCEYQMECFWAEKIISSGK